MNLYTIGGCLLISSGLMMRVLHMGERWWIEAIGVSCLTFGTWVLLLLTLAHRLLT